MKPRCMFVFAIYCPLSMIGWLGGDMVDAELKRLEGEWRILTLQEHGKPEPEKAKSAIFVFRGAKVTVRHPGGESVAIMTLNPSKNPKWLDTTDKKYGQVMLGIYLLEGDELKLCFGKKGQRPTEFSGKGNERFMILKRKKSK